MAEIWAAVLRTDETLAGFCPATEVRFPASRYTLEDALERARISPKHPDFELRNYRCRIPGLAKHLPTKTSLEALNFLAQRLEMLSGWERIAYEGMLKGRAKWPLGELVNLTFNLSECQVTNLPDDRHLGKFLAHHGLLPELDGVSETVLKWIDWARVGAYKRKAEGGVFTSGGYVVNDAQSWKQIYSQKLLQEEIPNSDTPINGIFRVYSENLSEPIDLPTEDFLKEMRITKILSNIPPLEQMLEPQENLFYLNRIAKELVKMPHEEQIKFKAVLEYEGCADLTQALKLSRLLEQYTLFPELDTPEDYGKWLLLQNMQKAESFALELLSLRRYGEVKMEQNCAKRTSYGILQKI